MMDFNLILLFVGLGLLGIVVLFALWGFLGGLKRELACVAVFIVLLVLAWLVFGNSGILLNYSGGLVDTIRSNLNLPASKGATVWQTILDYLKSMEGLNLAPLLVEGKETYSFVYSIVSCVATIVLLVGSTLVVVIITPIIRLISHIVMLIINGAKKRKAKKQAAENGVQEEAEEPAKDDEADDAILVLKGIEGANDAVVTVSENELPAPKKTKKRVWGAVVGALKGVFLIILLFAPISGICATAKVATTDTRELISNLVESNTTKQTVAEQKGIVDTAFDFVDSYGDSAIGKFVESSAYFFGQSFSTLLFDSMASIKTSTQNIKLRQELIVFIEAVNALEGNIELGTWTDEQVATALEALKDSKLLPEVMPVAIEYASEIEMIKSALDKAMQTTAFLSLRDVNWDKDLEIVLDALKEAYKLDIFPLESFNVLTMDEEILRSVVKTLSNAEFINKILPIAIRTGVKLDAVENIIGEFNQKINLENVNWKEELLSLVDIYATFQEYGYTDFEQITNASLEQNVQSFIIDNFDTTVSILDTLIEMAIFNTVAVPMIQAGLDNFLYDANNGFLDFANIINLKALSTEDWKEDIHSILDIAKLAVSELDALELDLSKMDIESEEAIEAMKTIVQKALTLNLLGNDATKNDLIIAVFTKFKLFNVEDLFIKSADGNAEVSILENVNWHSVEGNIGEIETLMRLLDVYKRFVALDQVNMKELSIDFIGLLEDEAGVDVLVSALEELVESELVLSLIDPAVNKYLLPITDEYDDDNLVKDIFNRISNKEMAEEIIKIVKAIKEAQKLGLFDVINEGLSALKYQETEAIINIIDTIFDSKILKGVEGRVIRIILKATKILDVEKGLLNDINFDGERDVLVAFVHAIENVLKDPDFELFNENGELQIDMEYVTKPEIFKQLMNGLEIVLGTFSIDDDGNFVETEGSKLVAALLPGILSKYVLPAIPEQFKELVEIVDLENIDGQILTSDLRRVVYIASQLVEMDVQTLLVGSSIVYTDKLQNVYNIIDALFDIQMLEPCRAEVFAWGINYLTEQFLKDYNVQKVEASDFANVDWKHETEVGKEVITDIIKFLEENELESTEKLMDFIKSQGFKDTSFVTTENATKVMDILTKLLELDTLEALAPIAFQVVVNQLVKNNVLSRDFWEGSLTGAQLIADLHAVTRIVDTLINKMNFVESWRENFENGILELPEAEALNSIIAEIFEMNLVKGYEAELVGFVLEKYLPDNKIIKAEDFSVDTITDWANESTTIQNVISIVLDMLSDNEFETVQEVIDFVKEITTAGNTTLKEYITDENISYVSQIINEAANSKLVANILPAALQYAIDNVTKDFADLSFLKDLTSLELQSDLYVVSDIINVLVDEGIACVIVNDKDLINAKDVNNLLETAKVIIGKLNSLNIVTKHENELMSTLINKGFDLAKLTDFTLTAQDLENVDWNLDFASIQQVLTHLQSFVKDNNLTTYKDVTEYFNTVTKDIKVAITDVNGHHAVNVVRELVGMGVVKALLPQIVNYGVDKAVEAKYDISFIKDANLTNNELAEDVLTICNIVIDLLDLEAIKIYKGEAVSNLDEAAIKDVALQLSKLNILSKYSTEWLAFIVNFALDKLNIKDFNIRYNASNFEGLTAEDWANDTEKLGQALVDLTNVLDELFADGYTVKDIQAFINDKGYTKEENITDELITHIASAMSNLLAIVAINPVVVDFVNYGVDKLAEIPMIKNEQEGFATLDVNFIKEIATREVLSHDVINIGEIAKVLVKFGLLEYLNTKEISHMNTSKLAPIFDQINEMELFKASRAEWMTLMANLVMKVTKLQVQYTPEDFAGITDEVASDAIEHVKAVVNKSEELLTLWQLESLTEIMNFVKDKGYMTKGNLTPEAVNIVVDAAKEVTQIEPLQAMLPKLALYGIDKLYPTYILKFAKPYINDGTLSGAVLAEDIRTILDIVLDGVEFGGLDIFFKTYLDEPFEIKFEYISSIIQKIEKLNTLEADYNNWMAFFFNVVIGMTKINTSMDADYLSYMNNEAWHEDFARLVSIVDSIAELAKNNNLTYYSDIKLFIDNKGYTLAQYVTDENLYAVIDIIENLINGNAINPYLEKVISGVIKSFVEGNTKLPNLTFVKEAIQNKEYTGQLIKADLQNILNMARDVVEFGFVELMYTKGLSNINVQPIHNIIEKLNDLYLFHISEGSWFEIIFEQVFKALKADTNKYKVDKEEYSEMTSADWDADFASLANIVDLLGELLESCNITSSTQLTEFIKNKNYQLAQYATDNNVLVVAEILSVLGSVKALSPALDDLALFAVAEKVKLNEIDLTFLEDVLSNGELTGQMLSSDVKVIASIIVDAVALDVIDYIFYKKINNFDLSLVSSILDKVADLNTVSVAVMHWAALGFNQLFKALKIEDKVSASDFEGMNAEVLRSDVNTLIEIVKRVDTLLSTNNVETLDELIKFFNEKQYLLAQYANNENALAVLGIMDFVGMIKVLEPALPILAKFGISKIPADKVNVSFVNSHLGIDLTGEMLASDIRTLSAMLEELVEFGVIDYVYYKEIKHIDMTRITNALAMLNDLNIYTVEKEDWLVLGINQLLAALKVEERVDVNSFSGLNADDEVNHLIDALGHVDTLLTNLNIESTTDLQQFIKDKGYINGQYLTQANLDVVLNAVEDLAQMQTVKVLLPVVARWGIDKVKGNDLNFLKEALHNNTFTSDELIDDVKTVISMARKGVELGLFDAIFDIDMKTINEILVAQIVAQIEELNIFTKLRTNWVALALNKALAFLEISVTPEELETITDEQWLDDNQKLQNAVVALCNVFEELGLTYKSAIQSYLSNKNYLGSETFSDTNIESLTKVLSNLLLTNTADVVFAKVLHALVVKADKAGYDISFVENSYVAEDLVSDIPAILNVAKNLVEFGIREYINDKEISNIDMTYIANAVSELENMLLFTKFRVDWIEMLATKALTAMKFKETIDYSVLTLTEAEWKEDNENLQTLVLKLGEILDNNNLNKYSEVIRFFKDDKKHTLEETYTDENLNLLADALKVVLSFNSVDALFPQILSIAIDKAEAAKLNITFLTDLIDTETVKNDVDVLVQMFRPLCKFGLFEFINTKTLTFLNVEYLNPVIALIPSLGIYNVNREAWAAAIVNCISSRTKLDITVSESDFAGIDWDKENVLFQETITMLDKFLVSSDLVLISNIKALQDRKFKIQEQYANAVMANHLVDAVEALSNLASFNVVSVDLVKYAFTKLKTTGYNFTFLVDGVSNEEMVEDVKSIIVALRNAIDFGLVEQIFKNEVIDYTKKDSLYAAIEQILNLNMLEGKGNDVVIAIFDKLGIDSAKASGTVRFNEEYNTVVTVLDNLITILENYEIDTVSEVTKMISILSKKFKKIDVHFDENLTAISEIVSALSKDDLFAFVIMPISEKYLSKENLTGIADLHNIYNNVAELRADLHSVYVTLVNIVNLHVYDFLVGNIDYPFDNVFNTTNIVNSIFNMNYFNMPGRMDAFVKGLDKMLTKVDLSGVNGANISLADDADNIVEMINNLSQLLTKPEFAIKNKHDVDNKVSVKLSFFFKKDNLQLEVNAIEEYMNTTLYGETGATILVVLVPLLKNVLKDYWTALDLDNYNMDKINHDADYIKAIFESIMDLDVVAMSEGYIEYSKLNEKVDTIIDSMVELQLLEGHYNDLVTLLLRDFVYNKKLGKYTIENGTFDVENVDFENDLVMFKEIVHEFIDFMTLEGVNNFKVTGNYFKSLKIKEFIAKEECMDKLADMINSASQLTLVQFNAKALYETFLVPALGNNIKYADYRNASNEEIYADIVKLPELITTGNAMNLGGIINGETIDYVGTDGNMPKLVAQLLEMLGTTNWMKYNLDTLLVDLSKKVEGLATYNATYEVLDVQDDLDKIAKAYSELAEYLNSPLFPAKTINEFKSIKFNELYKDAYTYIDSIVEAYDLLANTTIAPYFVPTLVKTLKDAITGRLQSVVEVLDVNEMTFDQVASDAKTSASLVRHLVEANVVDYLINKDAQLPTDEAMYQLIDDVFNMYIINTKFNELFEALFTEFHVDMTDMNLDVVSSAQEKEVMKGALTEVLAAMHEYGINSVSEIKPILVEFLNALKANPIEFLRKVYQALRTIDVEHIVKFVEIVDESVLMNEVFLPLYNKVLNRYSSLSSYAKYLSLDGYTKEAFASDKHLVALALRTLYTSEYYKVYTDNQELTVDQISLAQEAVRTITKLQLLELKKQTIIDVVAKLAKVDLSAIKVDMINVENDGMILAEALPALYTICRESNRFHFRIRMLGNTELMNAMIDVLELFFESTTSHAATPVIVRKLTNKLSNILNVKFSEKTDEQVYSLCEDIIIALRALSDMGAFSNNGIDLTNKELTDKVFAVIYNNVNLRSYRRYFDKLTRNIAEYGVLPVDYSQLGTRAEYNAVKQTVKEAIDLMKSTLNELRNKNYSIVADDKFQADVTSLIKTALTSELIAQVFMPIVVGTTKVATENYGKFAMFEGMTNDEFVNVALPDMFKMIKYANILGVLNKKVIYKDVDTIIALAELVVTSTVTKDSLNDLLPAIAKFAKYSINKEELVEANIDYVQEVAYLKEFLKGIKAELQNISLNDTSTLMSKEFLLAVSNAGKNFEESKLAKLYMKRVMRKVINKVSSTTDVFNFMLTALNSSTYTNEQAMEDYMLLLNVAEQAAYINFLGSEIDYAALDGHIDILLENLFALNAVKGNEEAVMSMILGKLTFVDTSSIDLSQVDNWDQEFQAFTQMCQALATLCADQAFDINNISADMFENVDIQDKFIEFVDKASKSYVGSEMFKELFKTNVEPNLPEDAQGIIDIDELPNEKWAEEFKELFEIYDYVSKGIENLTVNETLYLYDTMFGLNGKDGLEAVKNDYNKWLVKIVEEAHFTTPNTKVSINTNAIPHENAAVFEEVMAIRGIIENIAGYLDPTTDRIFDFDYSIIETIQDYEMLAQTLIAISKSLSMREIILGVISDAATNNTDKSGDSSFTLTELLSDNFWKQYSSNVEGYTGYDETFWTEEELTTLAIIVASANALGLGEKGNADIFTMDLGTEYADVAIYNNVLAHNEGATTPFPSQVDGANQVGLCQFIQLIAVSDVFDATAFGGEKGIIAYKLKAENISDLSGENVRPLGELDSQNNSQLVKEMRELTVSLQMLKDLGLLTDNADISGSLFDLETQTTFDLLTSINNSTVLRPMLSVILYKATSNALIASGIDEENVDDVMQAYAPAVVEQYDSNNSLKSVEEYNQMITEYVELVESVKSQA